MYECGLDERGYELDLAYDISNRCAWHALSEYNSASHDPRLDLISGRDFGLKVLSKVSLAIRIHQGSELGGRECAADPLDRSLARRSSKVEVEAVEPDATSVEIHTPVCGD